MDWQDYSIIGPYEQLIADFESAFRRILPEFLFFYPPSSILSTSSNIPSNKGGNITATNPTLSRNISALDQENNTNISINTDIPKESLSSSSTLSANESVSSIQTKNVIRTTYISLPIDNDQVLLLAIQYCNIPCYHHYSTSSSSKQITIGNQYPDLVSSFNANHYNNDIIHKLSLWFNEDHYILIQTINRQSSNDILHNLSASLSSSLLLPYKIDPSLCKKILSAATIALEHLELNYLSPSVPPSTIPLSSTSSSSLEFIRSLSIYVQVDEPSEQAFLGHATHRYCKNNKNNKSDTDSSNTQYIQSMYRTDQIVSRSWFAPVSLAYNGYGILSSTPHHLTNYIHLLQNFIARLIDNRTITLPVIKQYFLHSSSSQSNTEFDNNYINTILQLKEKFLISNIINYKWRIGMVNNSSITSSMKASSYMHHDTVPHNHHYRINNNDAVIQTLDIQSMWSDTVPNILQNINIPKGNSTKPYAYPESPNQVTLNNLYSSLLFTLRIHWAEKSWITRTSLFYPAKTNIVPSDNSNSSNDMNPTLVELLSFDNNNKDTLLSSLNTIITDYPWKPKPILDSFYPSWLLLTLLNNTTSFCTLASRLIILYEALQTAKLLASLDMEMNTTTTYNTIETPEKANPTMINQLQTTNTINLTSPGFGMPVMMNASVSPVISNAPSTPYSISSTSKLSHPWKQEISAYKYGSECLLTLPIRSFPSLYSNYEERDENTNISNNETNELL